MREKTEEKEGQKWFNFCDSHEQKREHVVCVLAGNEVRALAILDNSFVFEQLQFFRVFDLRTPTARLQHERDSDTTST